MKAIKIIMGTLGVLLSVQPLVSWAADGNDPTNDEPIVVHADGNRPIIIEGVDQQSTTYIQDDGQGHKTLTIKSGQSTPDSKTPLCGGGA
jgi:hypothetical protein